VSDKQHPILPALARSTALLALYFLGGLLLKKSALPFGQGALVWPPAGLALAAVLVLGYGSWPVIVAGTYLFLFTGGVPFGIFTVAMVLGNTFIALGCGFLLKQVFKFENAQERMHDVAAYLLVAGGLDTALNAALNAASLAGEHQIPWTALRPNLLASWMPNMLAVLVLTPVLIAWMTPSLWRWNLKRTAEALVCVAGLVFSSLAAFWNWFAFGAHNYPLICLPVPFLLWGAFRFGPRGATTGTLVVAGLAIYFRLRGHGLFLADGGSDALRLLGSYVGIMVASNLLFAAAAAGRLRAENNLAENEKRLRTTATDQSELICRFLPDGKITLVNQAFCEFHGQPEAQLLGTDFFQRLTSGEATALRGSLAALTDDQPVWTFDRRAVAADDHVEWQQYNLRRFAGADANGFEYQAVIQNITSRKQAELALQEAKGTLEKNEPPVPDRRQGGQRRRRPGQPRQCGQERISGEHEPRDPHAIERHSRHGRTARADTA